MRVINVGSDVGSITPMLEDIERRTGQLPATLLADGGHLKFDCLREAAARGVNVTCVVLAAAAGVGLGASGRARPKRDPGKVWTAKAGQTSSRTPADSIYALAVGLDGRRA